MREKRLSPVLALALFACAEARPVSEPNTCFQYANDIQPLINNNCLECHREGTAGSTYRVDTLAGIFARNPDTGGLRVTPGTRNAPFLAAARGDVVHSAVDDETLATLTTWVVDCQASTVRTEGVHPQGWVNYTSEDFHGRAIKTSAWETAWDLRPCVVCHGQVDDPSGGPSGVSCLSCHASGPTACDTCHGQEAFFSLDPEPNGGLSTRIHRAHLQPGATLGQVIACDECHQVPDDWRELGHVWADSPRNLDASPAEVALTGLASASLPGLEGRRAGAPAFDGSSCTNIYCHGHALGSANTKSLDWYREPVGVANCELCHGMPPNNHPPDLEAADCVDCHSRVVDADGNIIDASLHIDGELSLGPSDECSACHGQGSLGAPPPSLSGATDRTDPVVGLHAEHLTAGAYGAAVPCSGCHLVPSGDTYTAAVTATGHMDSARPAELFADPSGLALADGAEPSYDAEAGTCSNTYCHGGGQSLLEDDSASVARTLPWSPGAGTIIICGSCHGVAPNTPEHPRVSHRTTCGFCHANTVDSEGQIIVGPEGSTHINGVVDL